MRSRAVPAAADPWPEIVALARSDLDASRTNALDRIAHDASPAAAPVRLLVLSSCTTAHLHAAIRIAGLRRDLPIEVVAPEYGQYRQTLTDPAALAALDPAVVLLALDAVHLATSDPAMDAAAVDAELDRAEADIRRLWAGALAHGCAVIHQLPLPIHPPLMGQNEHRLPGSPAAFVRALSARLRAAADADGVDVLDLSERAAIDGLAAWHDRRLWWHAKQEVRPQAAPF